MALLGYQTWTSVLQFMVFLCFTLQDGGGTFDPTHEKSVDCNPMVDIVFLFDGHESVSSQQFFKQKRFIIDILQHHLAPAGAVQVGYAVCTDEKSSRHELKPLNQSIMRNLTNLSQINGSSLSNHSIPCIATIQGMFRNGGRSNVLKIAVLIVADDKEWRNSYVSQIASEMKSNHISILVIAVGNKDFKYLNSLRNIASKEDKFFVLSSFDGLSRLSSDLSTGSCLPISLNVVPDQNSIQRTTMEPVTRITQTDTCRKLIGTKYYEKYVPFLGWLRSQCHDGWDINVSTCACEKINGSKSENVRSSERTQAVIKGRIISKLGTAEGRHKIGKDRNQIIKKRRKSVATHIDTTVNVTKGIIVPTRSFTQGQRHLDKTFVDVAINSFNVSSMFHSSLLSSDVTKAIHQINSDMNTEMFNSVEPSFVLQYEVKNTVIPSQDMHISTDALVSKITDFSKDENYGSDRSFLTYSSSDDVYNVETRKSTVLLPSNFGNSNFEYNSQVIESDYEYLSTTLQMTGSSSIFTRLSSLEIPFTQT